MYMCLVLFVVSKIFDSRKLSCLQEMGVEYYLVPGMYQRKTAVWEGRGATARPRKAKWGSGDAAVYVVTEVIGWNIQIL